MRSTRFIVAMALALASVVALALPTVEAVQAEVQRGNWAQAETMMHEVVAAKPGSARAHYVYAEILAHNRRFEQAAAEAARARQIDPSIGFADPGKFAAFEKTLERQQSVGRATPTVPAAHVRPAAVAPQPQAAAGTPAWVWGLGLAGIAAIVFVVVSRRRQASALPGAIPAGAAYGAPAGPVPVGGASWGQPAPAQGSGLLGVGLAAAGGVAAGMLAERMLHGGRDSPPAATPAGSPQADGLVPGMFDDESSGGNAEREFEQRPIDFGQGDGWGGEDGGFDAGSGDESW